jgi:hypothetical protein
MARAPGQGPLAVYQVDAPANDGYSSNGVSTPICQPEGPSSNW